MNSEEEKIDLTEGEISQVMEILDNLQRQISTLNSQQVDCLYRKLDMECDKYAYSKMKGDKGWYRYYK